MNMNEHGAASISSSRSDGRDAILSLVDLAPPRLPPPSELGSDKRGQERFVYPNALINMDGDCDWRMIMELWRSGFYRVETIYNSSIANTYRNKALYVVKLRRSM